MTRAYRASMRYARKILIVGNGMVGHRFCAKLRERAGPDAVQIVVFGEEPRPAYDRVHLSSFFAGSSAEELLLAPASWYAERSIRLHTGERVTHVDRASKRVVTASGLSETYDTLVLATGSAPYVPPALSSVGRRGVFVYRTWAWLHRGPLEPRSYAGVATESPPCSNEIVTTPSRVRTYRSLTFPGMTRA